MTEEHIGYSIICEGLEERDGELEWHETEVRLCAGGSANDAPLEDYVRVARDLSECEDVRNVRLVEVLRVEREILKWRTT